MAIVTTNFPPGSSEDALAAAQTVTMSRSPRERWNSEWEDGSGDSTRSWCELDYRRLESPTLSWRSIDSFKEAVEKSISQEVYSPPSDQQVHNSINQQRLRTLEEIDSIAAGRQG